MAWQSVLLKIPALTLLTLCLLRSVQCSATPSTGSLLVPEPKLLVSLSVVCPKAASGQPPRQALNEQERSKASRATTPGPQSPFSGQQLGCGRTVPSVLQDSQRPGPRTECPAGSHSTQVTSSGAAPSLRRAPHPFPLLLASGRWHTAASQSRAGRPVTHPSPTPARSSCLHKRR